MAEKEQTMDTSPPPADTQETSEHEATKRVNTTSNDSFSHQKMYVRSRVKSQTEVTTSNFTSEIHARFFRPNTAQRLAHQKSELHDKKRRNSELSLYKKVTTLMF
jgi:hypothetical protein